MQALANAGLVIGDDLLPSGPSNPDGHFEDRALVRLHDMELARLGGSWHQPPAGNKRQPKPGGMSQEFATGVATALTPYLTQAAHWGFKDPRTCLFLRQWQTLLPTARYVFVYREPAACVRSLLTRQAQAIAYQPVLRGKELFFWQNPDSALALWSHYNRTIVDFSQANRDKVIVVSYESLLQDLHLPELVNQRFTLSLSTSAESGVRQRSIAATAAPELPDGIQSETIDTAMLLLTELDSVAEDQTRLTRRRPITWSSVTHKTRLARQLTKLAPAATNQIGKTSTLTMQVPGRSSSPETDTDTDTENYRGTLPTTPAFSASTAVDALHEFQQLQKVGSTEAAKAWVTRYARQFPENCQLNIAAGRIQLSQGYPGMAAELFERAHRAAPRNHVPLMLLGLVARRNNDHALAITRFEQAIERVPENPGLHLYLSQSLHAQSEYETALQVCTDGLSLQAEHEPLIEQAIICMLALRRFSTAAALCRTALQKNPENAAITMQYYHVLAADGAQRPQALPWFYRAVLLKVRAIPDYTTALEQAIQTVSPSSRQAHFRHQIERELERLLDSDKVISSLAIDAQDAANYCTSSTVTTTRETSIKEIDMRKTNKRETTMRESNMRLAMSILVRDEADIIEANIRHHARLGVSTFIVTDNGSVDGTRHILAQLQYEFNITIIDEPAQTIDQDLWVTRMAQTLMEQNAADWVINNDADEFWLPQQGSLIDAIEIALRDSSRPADNIGLLYCARHNLIPSQEAINQDRYTFRDNHYRVVDTWFGSTTTDGAWHENGSHIMIRTLPGKVIARLDGLQAVAMGNHGATHTLDKIETDAIEIAHYPVRSFRQFEKKVINYGSSLKNNQRFSTNVSRHLRHWFQRHLAGQLAAEYDDIVLPERQLMQLLEQGILVREPAGEQNRSQAAA